MCKRNASRLLVTKFPNLALFCLVLHDKISELSMATQTVDGGMKKTNLLQGCLQEAYFE